MSSLYTHIYISWLECMYVGMYAAGVHCGGGIWSLLAGVMLLMINDVFLI